MRDLNDYEELVSIDEAIDISDKVLKGEMGAMMSHRIAAYVLSQEVLRLRGLVSFLEEELKAIKRL